MMSISNIFVPLLLINNYQLHAVGMGLVASSILGNILYYSLLTRLINLKLDFRNILLTIVGIGILCCSLLVSDNTILVRIIYFLLTCSMLFIFIKNNEWQDILKLIKNLKINRKQ